MTKRARLGLLADPHPPRSVLFLVVRLKKNDDSLPISAPIPPSSVPTTSSDLAQLQLRLAPVASVAEPDRLRGPHRRHEPVRHRAGGPHPSHPQERQTASRSTTSRCSTSPTRSRPAASKDCSGSRSRPTGARSTSRSRTATRTSNSTRSRSTATTPTPSKRRTLLTIPDFAPNHNGGGLVVGPDGFLYWAMGDGGGAGDPRGSGQNPKDLLGDILRIDPAHAGHRRPSLCDPARQSLRRRRQRRARGLAVRAAQPVAVLLRPVHPRPVDRRRRAGRDRRDRLRPRRHPCEG